MIPDKLPTCRTILLNAWMATPSFAASVQAAQGGKADMETMLRLQKLMHTPMVGRGMKWFLQTVAA